MRKIKDDLTTGDILAWINDKENQYWFTVGHAEADLPSEEVCGVSVKELENFMLGPEVEVTSEDK